MKEEDILGFIAATITSVWAFEVLLLLRREPGRHWSPEALVQDLRGSAVAVADALASLENLGLVAGDKQGHVYYAPASPRLEEFVSGAAELYATKPVSVIRSIAANPNEKLRHFADAFRFKE